MSVKGIKVTDELKALINKHEGRSNFALQTSISTTEKLLTTFDEYVRVEIDELNQQILLLETVRRDLKKEKGKIRRIQTRFNAIHDRLKRISISRLSRPVQSRFRCLHLPRYTEDRFLEVSAKVLPKLKIAPVIGKGK